MSTKYQRGFTLVEVAIVAPIMILVALSIVAILITLVTSTIRPNATSMLMQQQEKAFDVIESDINNSYVYISSTSSSGFLSSLPSGFTDSSPSDYSSPPSGTTVLRLQTFNQIVNPSDTTGTKVIPAFKDTNTSCSNTTDMTANNIVPIVIIYYVKNNVLYRRTLTYNYASTPPQTCGTKLAKQTTCSTGCTSEDLALVTADKIDTFSVDYYTGINNNTLTNNDPTLGKSAKVTIGATLQAGGDAVSYTSSIRASRLNP
ncbi:MAG: prepilin-type N-terminal cleavage/methylation domain-containing protein [Candidatus Saccharibacteria bacterium]|nr:prepilin-type N-terminal cleavage/methylation domain-containing protein [Candidatus Saccharibacteria bacterium]